MYPASITTNPTTSGLVKITRKTDTENKQN